MRFLFALLFSAVTGSATALAQEDDVAAGQAVYDNYCTGCHGAGLRNPGTSFDLRELTAEDRARFDTAVLDGKNMMPPWRGTVSEDELDQLWAYVRAYAYE